MSKGCVRFALREHAANLLPKANLIEMALEINALTGFAEEFTHVSEANARATFTYSICTVSLA